MTRTFEAIDSEVAACRGFVRRALAEWGLEAHEVVLLANELVTNAVVHARSPFRVLVCYRGSRVRVAVSDDNSRLPEMAPVPLGSLSGRGLAMVVALADDWGIESLAGAGKTIWFELEAPSAA